MRNKYALLLALWLPLCLLAPVVAEELYPFDTPQQEQRFRQLLLDLRCPKCQNQAIGDSDAPIARDMRDQVAAMIRAGRTDEQIVNYFVQRYGSFVSYRPPITAQTVVLWLAPLLVILFGGVLVFLQIRRARRIAEQEDIS